MSERFHTLSVHAGESIDEGTGALDAPIVLSSAYGFESAEDAAAKFASGDPSGIYGRWHNPSVAGFERKIASLEGGERAVATASGMAAITAAILAHVTTGDHVIAPASLYAETAKLIREPLARLGITSRFVDMTAPFSIEPGTRVVWVETPANPTLAVTDIAAIAARAHAAGAIVIADNTFATPVLQRPLSLGADLVVHSATKWIGGHGDAIGGVVVGSEARCHDVHTTAVRAMGAVMSPFTAWTLMRGARTLALRVERASQSAMTLATRLAEDTRVERVHYPGLESHPGHAIAKQQMPRGFGGLLSFELRGGLDAGRRAYDAVRVATRAVSLGDVRTLVTHPATTTHVSMTEEARRAGGIADGLMRLSVGIEDVEDLWADLDGALG